MATETKPATEIRSDAPAFDHIMIFPEPKEQQYLVARAKMEGLTPSEVALKCIAERASGGVPTAASTAVGTAQIDLTELKKTLFDDLIEYLGSQYHFPAAGNLHKCLLYFKRGEGIPAKSKED